MESLNWYCQNVKLLLQLSSVGRAIAAKESRYIVFIEHGRSATFKPRSRAFLDRQKHVTQAQL